MLANSIKYAEKVEEIRQAAKIKKVLTAQVTEFITSYHAVLYNGISYSGGLLKPEEYRKRWNRKEVIKTHSFIRRKIESYFGYIPTFLFTNRHGDHEDVECNCKKDSFHTDTQNKQECFNKYQIGRNWGVKTTSTLCVYQRSKVSRATPKLTKTSESSNRRAWTNLWLWVEGYNQIGWLQSSVWLGKQFFL